MTDLFKEKAQDWDANEMRKALSSAISRCIVEHAELNDQMYVMDFGAGTGLITSQVAPHVKKVTAVDVSQSMLQQLIAKQQLKEKVEPLCHDIIQRPLDTRFDLIVSAMAMHHVEDTDKMLQRFAEHLKPGAGVALSDLDKEDGSFHPKDVQGVFHNGFDRMEFQKQLERNGFKNIRFITAHTINKDGKQYPVFVAFATKG